MPINNIPGVGPTNADIATAVAAPSAATIAAAVAAPSAATIATSVAAAVPTLAQINTSVSTYASSTPTWTYIGQTAFNIAGSTFSSLSGYKMYKLVVVNMTNATAAGAYGFRINGDTASNYAFRRVDNSGSVFTPSGNFQQTYVQMGTNASSAPTGMSSYNEVIFNDANTANNFKTGTYQRLGDGGASWLGSFAWNSTSSITSITFLQVPANGLSSSGTCYLYGAN